MSFREILGAHVAVGVINGLEGSEEAHVTVGVHDCSCRGPEAMSGLEGSKLLECHWSD